MGGEKATAEAETDGIELDVYLRHSTADEARRRQQSVLERVETLRGEGVVEGATVRRWSNRITVPVGIDPGGEYTAAIETFEELSAATEGTELSLEPGFEEREPAGDAERLIVFPVMALALYRNGDLRGIYPCVDGERCDTVQKCLDMLEAGEDAENLPA